MFERLLIYSVAQHIGTRQAKCWIWYIEYIDRVGMNWVFLYLTEWGVSECCELIPFTLCRLHKALLGAVLPGHMVVHGGTTYPQRTYNVYNKWCVEVQRPTQSSIPLGSVNEYQLRLGRQRYACHTWARLRWVHDKALYKSTFTLPYLTLRSSCCTCA